MNKPERPESSLVLTDLGWDLFEGLSGLGASMREIRDWVVDCNNFDLFVEERPIEEGLIEDKKS